MSRQSRWSRGAVALLLGAFLATTLAAGPAAARDRGADGNFSERRSRHFILLQDVAIDRYSGPTGSRRFEREVLATLEDAHRQVRDLLGIGSNQPVQVLVYDPGVFDRDFASLFRFRAAGFYNGLIHVRGDTAIDQRLIRTLHHEYLHAAFGSIGLSGALPGWLNEGLAEYFERLALGRRHLTPSEHNALRNALHSGAWIPLAQLSTPSFSGMLQGNAGLAYLESYATVEYMIRTWGARKMRSFCDQLRRTPALARALQRTYRAELADIETALLQELQ